MTSAATILLMTALLFSTSLAFQFNSSGYFTIVQFTDLHYGTSDAKDNRTQELQRNILSWVKPDLVVISGDGVYTNQEVPSGWYESQWEKFTAPVVEAGIPYAFTLGNHDNEGDLTDRQIVRLDATNPLTPSGQKREILIDISEISNFWAVLYDQN